MNRLPVDIFLDITDRLSKKDKQRCIYVCKRWHQLIREHNLYRSIAFHCVPYKFEKAFGFFNRNKGLGKQVETLELQEILVDGPSELPHLPKLFPNLKKLKWLDTENERFKVMDTAKNAFRRDMWPHLEELTADGLRLDSLDMLTIPHAFNNLINLTISCNTVHPDKQYHLVEKLVKQLHNLPVLDYMQLHYLYMTLADLAELHTNVPYLKKLVLENVVLYNKHEESVDMTADVTYGGQSSYDSHTVRHLKYFKASIGNMDKEFYDGRYSGDSSISDISNEEPQNDNIVRWLRFWGLKYRELETLVLTSTQVDLTDMTCSDTLDQEMAYTISNMHRLKDYQVTICPITDTVLRVLESNTQVPLRKFQFFLDNSSTIVQGQAFERVPSVTSQITTLKLINRSKYTKNQDIQEETAALIDVFFKLKRLDIQGYTLSLDSGYLLAELLKKLADSKIDKLAINACIIQDVYLRIEAIYRNHHESGVSIEADCYQLGNQVQVDSVLKEVLAGCVSYRRVILQSEIMCGVGDLSICLTYTNQLHSIDIHLTGEYRVHTRLESRFSERALYDTNRKKRHALHFNNTSTQLQTYYLNVPHSSLEGRSYGLATVGIDTKPDSSSASQQPNTGKSNDR